MFVDLKPIQECFGHYEMRPAAGEMSQIFYIHMVLKAIHVTVRDIYHVKNYSDNWHLKFHLWQSDRFNCWWPDTLAQSVEHMIGDSTGPGSHPILVHCIFSLNSCYIWCCGPALGTDR